MALDNVLKIYDEQGNPVDYDILASDVKFQDGKDLPTKLDELEQEIGEGGYTPPQGGIPKTDLATAVQESLNLADSSLQPNDKTQLQGAITQLQNALNTLIGSGNVQGAIDTFNEVTAFLNGIDTSDPTLANQLLALNNAISAVQTSLAAKANAADVYTKAQTDAAIAAASSGAVSVIQPDPADGTFTIRVGSTDYTINLNHTHENMAKLVVCEESDLPSTLDNSTIYAITYSGETEIEKLIIRGMEFTGGGGGGSSEPSYDAEIEYLQSTGTQYINTGVVGSTDFACEIKAEFTENQEGYDTLLGAYTSSAAFAVALAIRNATVSGVGAKNAAYAQFGDDAAAEQGGGTSPLVVSSVSTLGLHIYKSALQSGVISVDVDGTLLSKTYNGGAPSLLSMYLFARNRQDNGVGNFSKAKIYYCRIWSGGSLVRNFIPVRVGQAGYMYDQISGRLFGNSGSGDFTLGNDKQNN